MNAHAPDLRRLFASLDGRLSPRDQLETRVHLEACPACRAQFDVLRRTRGALRELGERMPVVPPQNPNAEAKLMQEVARQGAPGTRVQWWWLPVTAGATLLLALLVLPRLRGAAGGGESATSAATATSAAGTPAAATGAGVATVVAIRGQVEDGVSAEALHAGKAGEELPGSAVVRTGGDGEARLALVSGGEIALGPSTTLVLPPDAQGVIRLDGGTIDVQVTPRKEGERPFGIETEVARIEAIGTKFRVVHQEGATSVDVSEGKVRFVSLPSDEEQLVAAGKAVRVDGTGRVAEIPAGSTLVAAAEPSVGPAESVEPPEPAEPAAQQPGEPGEPVDSEAEVPIQVTRARGTIDGSRVRARVSRQRGAFQACYGDYMMRVAPQPVRVNAKFIVMDDGSVGSIDVNLTVDDQTLAQCVERVFRAIEFPRPQGGPARVFYPIDLSP
ncbi:MAG: FecR domain-containing protein [Deltaproteobacteria bacterium]|nr:FecR domain-containing protein [Deltaproteobacteria bacterium]